MKIKAPFYTAVTLALSLAILAGCSRKVERTDAQVAADVQNKIYSDAGIQSRQISVQAADGVVTLSGDVSSDTERATAGSDAGAVEGVKTVVNNLQVQQAEAAPPPTARQKPAPARREKKPKVAANNRHHHNNQPQPDESANAETQANNLPPAPPGPPAEQPAPPPPAPPPPPQKVTIPAGTQLSVRLNDYLDSERNQVGDTFRGSLSAPIVLDGETIIPSGADVVGRVADVKSAGRFAGNSVLTLELTSLSVNGRTYNLQTNQWSRQGKGEGKNTATKVGVGTAAGAILGGILGGGKGAAIGAAAGAGAGTGAAAAKKGEQIKLSPEAVLNFQTIHTLVVTPQSTNDRNGGRTQLQNDAQKLQAQPQ
jgi:outer membrane lipoprotein SlyB